MKAFLDKPWKINLILLLCSFSIYTVYFHHIFLNLNSILSSITGDALKNYYTYSYHIKNDSGILHFSGMNFPFGEHVVFTDCQPILTFILRLFPFTHNYLIGILHALLFTSYIITPLILNKIFLRLEVEKFSSFFMALAITLLSPQFAKINGGHHALAYGFVIPFSILLLLKFMDKGNNANLLKLFVFNFLLFLLHPYMGFSTSVFSLIALITLQVFDFNKHAFFKQSLQTLTAGLLPIISFKIFMKLSDQHPGRTDVPHGSKTLVENMDSLLAPDFGPFKKFLEGLFPNRTAHLEGHSYLGAFSILFVLLFLICIPFFFKRFNFKKEIAAVFISSFFLLLLSFGFHTKLLEALKIENGSLNQFRASCRFAWFFYYALPLFVIPSLYSVLKPFMNSSKRNYIFPCLAVLFFVSNLWEANYFFKKDEAYFWKFRNVLNEKFLNPEEKEIIHHINASKTQAIIPLPIFVLGSEMYDRIGGDNSMIPSMLYSCHTGVPIFGAAMSRTSISETEELIQLFNSYKKENPAMSRLTNNPFLVIKTKDPIMADEDRLLTEVKMFHKNDSLEFGEINKTGLRKRKLDPKIIFSSTGIAADSNNVVFVPFENRKPFLDARMLDYENIYTQDSNKLKSGTYILSFHYHYTRKIYTSLDLALIINKIKGSESSWQYYQRISILSGFYTGFAVLEYKIELEKDSRYEFMLKGDKDLNYKISHFMLRPENTSVITTENRDSLFNNFPD